MENEPQNLFQKPSETRSDIRLVERALRSAWLTPERRAGLQKKIWETAEQLADDPDTVKEFAALATLLEKTYEFDVKLAEREEERERKYGFPAAGTAPPAVTVAVETGGTIEQQREQLLGRIRAARTTG